MFKILKKEYLANNIWLMDIEAPRVAKHCQPGQFVIVKTDEKGERIPLTVCVMTAIGKVYDCNFRQLEHSIYGDGKV